MTTNISEQIFEKHCRKNKWGIPTDDLAQLDTVMALGIKENPDHPKYNTAISILEWASTRPDLELIERAERIWADLTLAGLITEPPVPWKAEDVDPSKVQPPYPYPLDSRSAWHVSRAAVVDLNERQLWRRYCENFL